MCSYNSAVAMCMEVSKIKINGRVFGWHTVHMIPRKVIYFVHEFIVHYECSPDDYNYYSSRKL